MKIKIGDEVIIISGKYKGCQGKILSICKKTSRVKVENLNMKTKHIKPKQNDDKGQITQIEGSIHQSNMKLKSNIK